MVNATPQAATAEQDGRTVLLQLIGEVAGGNKSAFAKLYGLTHAKLLGVDAKVGLLDVLDGQVTLKDALMQGETSGAWVLPIAHREFTPKEVFNTEAMGRLLDTLRQDFDLVILDTAPVLAIAETRVLASRSCTTSASRGVDAPRCTGSTIASW